MSYLALFQAFVRTQTFYPSSVPATLALRRPVRLRHRPAGRAADRGGRAAQRRGGGGRAVVVRHE